MKNLIYSCWPEGGGACDRLFVHTILKNLMNERIFMGDYGTYEMMREGMRVTLEIPEKSEEKERERKEIKNILTAVLRECIQSYFEEKGCG